MAELIRGGVMFPGSDRILFNRLYKQILLKMEIFSTVKKVFIVHKLS